MTFSFKESLFSKSERVKDELLFPLNRKVTLTHSDDEAMTEVNDINYNMSEKQHYDF